MAEEKRTNVLTGRYNMAALRKLQTVEDDFREKLQVVYGVDDPDDIPVEIDVHNVIKVTPDERRAYLTELLSGAPSDVTEIIDELIESIRDISPEI